MNEPLTLWDHNGKEHVFSPDPDGGIRIPPGVWWIAVPLSETDAKVTGAGADDGRRHQ